MNFKEPNYRNKIFGIPDVRQYASGKDSEIQHVDMGNI